MTKEQNELISKLFHENGKHLAQLAYRYTQSSELAEDLLQETMLIACTRIDILTEHENQIGWLVKTLWNLAKREMKKLYHTEVPLELDYIRDCTRDNSEMDLPMKFYLPPGLDEKEKEIVLMRIAQGMSYSEIAEIKGVSEDACRQQLSRAIRKCRSLMNEVEDTSKV